MLEGAPVCPNQQLGTVNYSHQLSNSEQNLQDIKVDLS